jgi:hypothetical protein
MERMLEEGSEYHELAITAGPLDGPEPVRQTRPPIGQRLAAGDLIQDEVSAVWGGQVAQEDQPVLLGPVPGAWEPVVALQREVFAAGLERLRPGTGLGEFMDFVNGFGAGRGLRTEVLLHGRGLGDDGPLLSPRASGERVRDVRIERQTAWVWKPIVWTADGRRRFIWGGDVVVTERGAEPLFRRPQGLVAIT